MTVREIDIALSLLVGTSGAITAYYWWRSSRVDIDPPISGLLGMRSSIDGDYSATIDALREIGRLNKIAAMWSAISAVLIILSVIFEPIVEMLRMGS